MTFLGIGIKMVAQPFFFDNTKKIKKSMVQSFSGILKYNLDKDKNNKSLKLYNMGAIINYMNFGIVVDLPDSSQTQVDLISSNQ